jgi:hypothetical protein
VAALMESLAPIASYGRSPHNVKRGRKARGLKLGNLKLWALKRWELKHWVFKRWGRQCDGAI